MLRPDCAPRAICRLVSSPLTRGRKAASTILLRSVVLYEFSFVAGERIVERLDKRIFVDEIAFPLCPRRENFFLLHLLQSFVIAEGFPHHRARFLQHFGELRHVAET